MYLLKYRISSNTIPGFSFLRDIFDPACKWSRPLLGAQPLYMRTHYQLNGQSWKWCWHGLYLRPSFNLLVDFIYPRPLNEASFYSEAASIWGNMVPCIAYSLQPQRLVSITWFLTLQSNECNFVHQKHIITCCSHASTRKRFFISRIYTVVEHKKHTDKCKKYL